MDKEFSLEEYLKEESIAPYAEIKNDEDGFTSLCDLIRKEFDKEWEETDDSGKNKKLLREKRAIMGYEEETGYYKERIKEILRDKNLEDSWYPSWYPNLVEGLFAEIYGLSGLAPWAYDMFDKYKDSSSAKLIGDRLYCLIDGKSCLQPQRISEKRRVQLKRALLLATPEERLEYGFHEVYLHNGIRITIFSGSRTKAGEDIIVFRKYLLKELTFDNLVKLRTIPEGGISVFKSMIEIGYNVLFAGQVRSGKTTFLQVWQREEDPSLEGLAIATDPETPWHEIMPNAPIMQLVADGKQLEEITKSLLRGDNDYVLLEEMRDAVAYNLALDITSTGTTRSKGTIHDNEALNIPYKMATKISEKYGSDCNSTIAQVFKSFDFIFEFCQDSVHKNKKILKAIMQLHYDVIEDQVVVTPLCKYDFKNEVWNWAKEIIPDKKKKGELYKGALVNLQKTLKSLYEENPLNEGPIFPAYYKSNGGNKKNE